MPRENPPIARAKMLIRKPVAEVFRAFVEPEITSKFWFSRGSDSLRQGNTVTWYWDWYGVAASVNVVTLEANRRIAIAWPTPVEWTFTPKGPAATFVEIAASGFTGSEEQQVAQALDSAGGFNLLLAGCKAYLEHGINLALVEDHDPDHHRSPPPERDST